MQSPRGPAMSAVSELSSLNLLISEVCRAIASEIVEEFNMTLHFTGCAFTDVLLKAEKRGRS
jgi:hypothetical protein